MHKVSPCQQSRIVRSVRHATAHEIGVYGTLLITQRYITQHTCENSQYHDLARRIARIDRQQQNIHERFLHVCAPCRAGLHAQNRIQYLEAKRHGRRITIMWPT